VNEELMTTRKQHWVYALTCSALMMGCAGPQPATVPPAATTSCARESSEVVLQVLGSGGPIADDARASSGYLIWVDGRARVLIDVGGGVFQRFASSGASLEDLEVVVISHLHVDHSGDLPALLKSAYFGDRKRPLPVVGPDGSELFPGLSSFLTALFGKQGAYPYLGWVLDPQRGQFTLQPHEVAVSGEVRTFTFGAIELEVVGVPHGVVPTLGARVKVAGKTLAFASDQRLDDPRFIERIEGVDLFVAHHAVPESIGGPASSLHARPSTIGKVASTAKVGQLVLSHHMLRAIRERETSLSNLQHHYRGPLIVADDLMCIPVSRK